MLIYAKGKEKYLVLTKTTICVAALPQAIHVIIKSTQKTVKSILKQVGINNVANKHKYILPKEIRITIIPPKEVTFMPEVYRGVTLQADTFIENEDLNSMFVLQSYRATSCLRLKLLREIQLLVHAKLQSFGINYYAPFTIASLALETWKKHYLKIGYRERLTDIIKEAFFRRAYRGGYLYSVDQPMLIENFFPL